MTQLGRPVSLFALSFALFLLLGNSPSFADQVVQPSPFGQMISNLNPANWKMPKMPSFRGLLPKAEEKKKIKKKKDGLVDEVSKTASRSWSRTKRALNPRKLNPANFFTASSRSPSKPASGSKEPGFFRSLFAPYPPVATNKTTNGFLSQPRPKP